jgi:hypothetical protein
MLNIQKIKHADQPQSGAYLGQYGAAGFREGALGWSAYLLKGSLEEVGDELGISTSPQGAIQSKRCGYSESLGRKRLANTRFVGAARLASIDETTVKTKRAFVTTALAPQLVLPSRCVVAPVSGP